jgi:hypothetical protein
MRIGIFSEVMPLSYLVFIPGAWFDRIGAWVARGRRRPAAPAPPAQTLAPPRPGRRRNLVLAVLAVQMGLIVSEQAFRIARRPVPRLLGIELTLIDQRQNWRMFAPDAPYLDVTWEAPGVLTDGSRVELTDAVAPQLKSHGGFFYSRWHRLRNMIITERAEMVLPLGRYLCRRYNGEHPGPPLERFELVANIRPTLPVPDWRPKREVVLRQSCSVSP